ncbi:hypothetical protein BSK63_12525 [Paenibacillus odorifer]|nr:hypothetical protein BSK63_12525 [Paenibacillus odorifer]OME36927.1 hypothetical protein BSK46_16290 [Paenibacillus odorifer]
MELVSGGEKFDVMNRMLWDQISSDQTRPDQTRPDQIKSNPIQSGMLGTSIGQLRKGIIALCTTKSPE